MSILAEIKHYVSKTLGVFRGMPEAVVVLIRKVFAKIHLGFSALVVVFALSSESVLHALNIPHVEGWWLTLAGGSAFATWLSVWFYKNNHRTDP